MTQPTLRGARISDASTLAPLLRTCDVEELKASSGRSPHDAILNSILASTWAITAEAEGRPFAIFGVAPWFGTRDSGAPWMLASDELYKHVKFMRRHDYLIVDRMLQTYPVLFNFIDARNHRSIRWLLDLGFDISGVELEYGVGRIPFFRFSRIAHV